MKLPRLPFLGRSEPKFVPTLEEQLLIETCTKFGTGHLESHVLIDKAGLPTDRRGPVEEIIRAKMMESVLKGSRERLNG